MAVACAGFARACLLDAALLRLLPELRQRQLLQPPLWELRLHKPLHLFLNQSLQRLPTQPPLVWVNEHALPLVRGLDLRPSRLAIDAERGVVIGGKEDAPDVGVKVGGRRPDDVGS